MCVHMCVCVRERQRERRRREGKSDFLFPSLRVGLLQGSGKQSALSLAVCVCVCVHVWGAGTVSQEDRVCIDENPPQPFDASFPPP